jgi:hypothetical protein
MEIDDAVFWMGMAETYQDEHWKQAVAVTEKVVRRAEPDWLEQLMTALLQVASPTFPMRYGFREALKRFALAEGDPEHVMTVWRIASAAGEKWGSIRELPRQVAEWLATAQPLEHLIPVFAMAQADDEIAACLLQEVVLRHDDLRSARAAVEFGGRLRAADHPLAILPLHRLPAEHQLGVPQYPGKPRRIWYVAPEPVAAPGATGIELKAAAIDWPQAGQAMNGINRFLHPDERRSTDDMSAEAKLFLLDRPLVPADFGATTLAALGLQSAVGNLTVHHAGTADVVGTLYGAGAYGRLTAWQSLAALTGTDGDPATLEGVADRCTWLFYTSDWHGRDGCSIDFGIAVLRSDHQSIAIIASTFSEGV